MDRNMRKLIKELVPPSPEEAAAAQAAFKRLLEKAGWPHRKIQLDSGSVDEEERRRTADFDPGAWGSS